MRAQYIRPKPGLTLFGTIAMNRRSVIALSVLWFIITGFTVLWFVDCSSRYSRPIARQRATSTYATTVGTIDGTPDVKPVFPSGKNPDGTRREYHDLTVWYSYTVNGTKYKSYTYSHIYGQFDGFEAADERARSISYGAPVTVHYDPSDPATSVLAAGEREIPREHLAQITVRTRLMPVFTMVGWIVLGFLWWKGAKR